MARSLKKGPFVDDHLMKKVEALNASGKKEVIMKGMWIIIKNIIMSMEITTIYIRILTAA